MDKVVGSWIQSQPLAAAWIRRVKDQSFSRCAAHGVDQLVPCTDAAILIITSTSLRDFNFLF